MNTENENPRLNLHQRLLAIMGDISYIRKRPKAGLPYPFVAHDDVSEALRPLFIKHGVMVYPYFTKHAQIGNKTVLDGSLVVVNVDNPADQISLPGFAEGIDPQDKGIGKAISYFVKSMTLKLFAIPTGEKDLEQDQIEHSPIDPATVRQALDLIDAEDGAGLLELTNPMADQEKIALWREFNSKTQKHMRELMATARETAS